MAFLSKMGVVHFQTSVAQFHFGAMPHRINMKRWAPPLPATISSRAVGWVWANRNLQTRISIHIHSISLNIFIRMGKTPMPMPQRPTKKNTTTQTHNGDLGWFMAAFLELGITWVSPIYLPSGKRLHNYGKSPFFYGKIHYKLPFSIAMLNYQRVSFFISFRLCFQLSSLSCIFPVDISTIVEDNPCGKIWKDV